MSDHLDLWSAETAALEPTDWEHWIGVLENIVGHDLDGDQAEDGYSYDGFHEMWKEGLPPAAAALRAFPHRRAEFAKYEEAERQYLQSAKVIASLATEIAAGKYFGSDRDVVGTLRHHIDRLDNARETLEPPTNTVQSWAAFQRSGEFMNAVLGPLPPLRDTAPGAC